jgi:hypothetical protein
MKKTLKLLSLSLLFIVVVNCNENNNLSEMLPQEITIQFDETKVINGENLAIKFSKVIEDSRCSEIL